MYDPKTQGTISGSVLGSWKGTKRRLVLDSKRVNVAWCAKCFFSSVAWSLAPEKNE